MLWYPEDLDKYVRRFHGKTLVCNPVVDAVLINVCLHGMLDEYRIFGEFSFSTFSRLMEAARGINESVQRTSRSDPTVQPSHGSIFRSLSGQWSWPLRKVKRSDHPVRRSQPIEGESLHNSLFCHHFLIASRAATFMGERSDHHIY